MTSKKFDCVEMKREGAARVMKRLHGMTRSEQLAYWNRATAELEEMKRRAFAVPAAVATPSKPEQAA